MTEKLFLLNMATRSILIRLLQPVEESVAKAAADHLERLFEIECKIDRQPLDLGFAYEPMRGQYYSSAILKRLKETMPDGIIALLAIAEVDLYVPGFNFVFGEAEISGKASIISLARLRPTEPDNPDRLIERVEKEATHEIGHVFGLRHCENRRCVMSFSPTLQDADIKRNKFCSDCAQTLAENSRQPVNERAR